MTQIKESREPLKQQAEMNFERNRRFNRDVLYQLCHRVDGLQPDRSNKSLDLLLIQAVQQSVLLLKLPLLFRFAGSPAASL